MIDDLHALRALAETGTMARAGVRLRVTASTVSKRIQALEDQLGRPLVEPTGRRVRLTPEAERLLREAEPLLLQLAEVLSPPGIGPARIRIAASHSLLASWLPAALKAAAACVPELSLDLRVHRGPAVLEWLRSGELDLAVCAEGDADPALRTEALAREEMVLVPAAGQPFTPAGVVPVITIEPHSLTWQALAPRIRRRAAGWGWSVEPAHTIESFPAVVQLARAGFGHGLVPRPLAEFAGVEGLLSFPAPGLWRDIVVAGRRRTWDRGAVCAFLDALRTAVPSSLRAPT